MARIARVTLASAASFALILAATGWLYLIQLCSELPPPAPRS
jgi:hypothetical protein